MGEHAFGRQRQAAALQPDHQLLLDTGYFYGNKQGRLDWYNLGGNGELVNELRAEGITHVVPLTHRCAIRCPERLLTCCL